MQTPCAQCTVQRPQLYVPRSSYDVLLVQLEELDSSLEEFEEAFGVTLVPVTEH